MYVCVCVFVDAVGSWDVGRRLDSLNRQAGSRSFLRADVTKQAT